MPSWPSRFLPGNPSSPASARTDSVASHVGATTVTTAGDISVVNADARTRSNSNNLSPRPSQHGRSISHPFPSILGGNKRIERKAVSQTPPHAELDIQELDDETLGFKAGPSLSQTPNHKAPMPADKDLVAGRCATCDTNVRWPRHLDVYRCTICHMINELKPQIRAPEPPGKAAASPRGETFSTARIPRKVLPLSIERTRALIDQCLDSYLKYVIQRHRANTSQRHTSASSTDTSLIGDFDPSLPPSRAPPPPPFLKNSDRAFSPSAEQDDASNGQPKAIFRPLENYLGSSLHDCTCLNASFAPSRPGPPARSHSEGNKLRISASRSESIDDPNVPLFDLDAKTLLLGDVAENGMWWTGGRMDRHRSQQSEGKAPMSPDGDQDRVNPRLLRIHWGEVEDWYHTILSCGSDWRRSWQRMKASETASDAESWESLRHLEPEIENDVTEARHHTQRAFLKDVESLLRRPGRPIKLLEDCRFLPILLANPLLLPQYASGRPTSPPLLPPSMHTRQLSGSPRRSPSHHARGKSLPLTEMSAAPTAAPNHHYGLLKKILGLIANLPSECHQNIIAWFCRLSAGHFRKLVDLVGGFVTHRLSRTSGRQRSQSHDPTNGLIPDISGPGAGTSAHLHAALGITGPAKSKDATEKSVAYGDDWQVRAAAKVMSLLYSANNSGILRRQNAITGVPEVARMGSYRQLLPVSDFYNTLLDYANLIADFDNWESRRGKFSFCQYPMFLSIWAKIHIMEYDARRQMESKARAAFFNSILNRKAESQYLVLKVRRDCLVDDSLKAVSEVVGSGQEDIKKGLRIEFTGEEGVDAGGLRKEWFLLLVREVFDPEHGLFTYDEDSHFCYFNPHSFETSDQFFLVGVLLGLAIYNSTILDIALPPFAFRKLLASAPTYSGPPTTSPTANAHSTAPSPRIPPYTLDDLAEFRPTLARGLRSLLTFERDVEATFCRDFVAETERYGSIARVPLCANGENRPVTNANRREFVDLYIQYLLDTSVARQYEPFKRGFFSVCGGNALSLFQPEEIELLVRGSDESLDVDTLKAVAVYEGWTTSSISSIPPRMSSSSNPGASTSPPTASATVFPPLPRTPSQKPPQPLVLPPATPQTLVPSASTPRSNSAYAALPLVPKPSFDPLQEPQIYWFWSVFASADPAFQRRILGFVTGSDRIPAMGAVNLVIKVQCMGEDWRRFPIARTCFNTIGLWRYRSREQLEEKLRRAVEEAEGFGLK